MARAIWKGELRTGGETIPVHLYSAVQDKAIHFHLLEARTGKRVRQHMVDPETGKEVPREQMRKGYALEPGVFVVIEPDEFQSVQPKPSRDIEILSFVPSGLITHQWYDRPYYLGPESDAGRYFALAAALENQKREGLARWVMRDKEYLGALRVKDGYLVLIALHYAEEVLSARELPRPAGRPSDPREIQMAEQLISVLEDKFNAADYRDEYRDRVLHYIEEKARGQKPKLAVVQKKRPAGASLTDVLAASLKAARKGKAVA